MFDMKQFSWLSVINNDNPVDQECLTSENVRRHYICKRGPVSCAATNGQVNAGKYKKYVTKKTKKNILELKNILEKTQT